MNRGAQKFRIMQVMSTLLIYFQGNFDNAFIERSSRLFEKLLEKELGKIETCSGFYVYLADAYLDPDAWQILVLLNRVFQKLHLDGKIKVIVGENKHMKERIVSTFRDIFEVQEDFENNTTGEVLKAVVDGL